MSKPEEIIIPYDTDKLDAIKQFSSESDLPLAEVLAAAAEKIYIKRVPLPVQQYIEKRPVTSPKARVSSKTNPKAGAINAEI